jgi:hypothetical protein
MPIKRIIPISAIFVVLMAFTIAQALAFLQNAQNVQNFHLADTYNNPHSLGDHSGNRGEAKNR